MHGYNFTERARKVLALARDEAHALNHEYVGTEHLLLGLIREGGGVASALLENLKVDTGLMRQKIEETVQRGRASVKYPDLPYTSRAKKSIELAMAEARDLSHNYVGTEHLLLGLLREEKGVAAMVLADAGLTLPEARAEVLRLLGFANDETRIPSSDDVVGVGVEIKFADGQITRSDFHSIREALEFLRNIHPAKLSDRQE
jgi:ATP-dependent Clp protease ATP-binding subunit ClpC